jgi:hypothetical protein
MSHRQTVRLTDSEADQHTIVFKHGKMVDILCPQTDSQQYQSESKTARPRKMSKRPRVS